MEYESVVKRQSEAIPGVWYTMRRMSFGRRMELAMEIRELSRRMEFAGAGASAGDEMEAAILAAEIEQLYLRWGLVKVEGLVVDGAAASPELLLERGPEELTREILRGIQSECGLSEEERKN